MGVEPPAQALRGIVRRIIYKPFSRLCKGSLHLAPQHIGTFGQHSEAVLTARYGLLSRSLDAGTKSTI
jgi:hypothetical protein